MTTSQITTRQVKSQQEWFDRIYKEYYKRLYCFAFNMLRDSDACKDILEDVFLMLWNHINEAETFSIKSYLFASVRNRVVDTKRGDERHKSYSSEYIRQATVYYADYSEEMAQDRLVEQMLSQLTPPTDQILEMCYLRRMKYSEAAEALGISPNTVKKHISKALKILRNLYKGEKDTYLE